MFRARYCPTMKTMKTMKTRKNNADTPAVEPKVAPSGKKQRKSPVDRDFESSLRDNDEIYRLLAGR